MKTSRVLKVLGGAVLGLALTYYVGVNALLATPLVETLFNLQPHVVQLHYSRAWTLVPLRVEVRDFRISTQDKLVQVEISAARARGVLHPWALLKRRFVATQIVGDEVTVRVRSRIDEGGERTAYLDELPPMTAFATPMRSAALEALLKNLPIFSLDLELSVQHVREVWIDRTHYQGDAEVDGTMRYVPFEQLGLDGVRLIATGELTAGGGAPVTLERVEVRGALGETDLRTFSLAAFTGLHADVNLVATAPPTFLNAYLTKASGLSTLTASGAVGRLEIVAQLDHGVVRDGGLLTYTSPALRVRLPFVEVAGAAAVHGAAADGRLSLAVEVAKVTLRQRNGNQLADAQQFTVLASSGADLAQLGAVDAALDLRGARVKALTGLNAYLPEGAGVRLVRGSGVLAGSLRLDANPPRASGKLALVGDDVSIANRSSTVTGRLHVEALIRSLDLTSGALDVSGSTIVIDQATVRADGRDWPNLYLRAVADPCVLTPRREVQWATKLRVGSSNLQPLLALFSANVAVPKVLTAFADSPKVEVLANIEVRRHGVELESLTLTSERVQAEGSVSLREQPPPGKDLEPWGEVVVHVGQFSAGVQLDGPKVAVVLDNLERWAHNRQALRHAEN